MVESETEQRLDRILEGEVAAGFRLRPLPAAIRAALVDNGLADIAAVRFSRNNPSRRRIAAALVQRQYHTDLRNQEILSNDQVMRLVVERGEWGPDKDTKIADLTESTNRLMSKLYAAQVSTDGPKWTQEVLDYATAVRQALDGLDVAPEEKERLGEVFNRWLDYNPNKAAQYTVLYAASQGRALYSVHKDVNDLGSALAQKSVEYASLLGDLQDRLDKVNEYVEMVEQRREMAELQTKRARIFADTVESRRDHTEELARLYTTCERCDDVGKPLGSLAPTFDGIWDFPDEVITWFTEESFLYHHLISDEMREYLSTFGFLSAARLKPTEPAPSAESPAAPNSGSGSEPAAETPANSTESLAAAI